MRVIAGSAKGHKLVAPKGTLTRPILSQVKEAIFNILFNVADERILDLFAGSGAVGIEALSRGAAHCTFVEQTRAAVDCIHKNLHHCHLEERASVLHMPVATAIKKLGLTTTPFDLIFVDPPYEQGLVKTTLALLEKVTFITTESRIIIEHHPKEPLETSGFTLTDQRQYGQTHITFLQRTT